VSGPTVVPVAFEATTRKWYVVDAERPDSRAVTVCAAVPDPATTMPL
jgi:hypothetical protein